MVVDVDPCLLAFDRLGGSVKFCKLLTTLPTVDWHEIEKFLLQVSPAQKQKNAGRQNAAGLERYRPESRPQAAAGQRFEAKKSHCQNRPLGALDSHKEAELNSAQVIHNNLTSPTGWELVFIRDGSKTIVAQTVKVQDIAAYTLRDRSRPKRDARIGMLPPKLAQIIINLAVGAVPEDKLQSICAFRPVSRFPSLC